MTMTLRKAQERGFTDLGWLQSGHSFSFGDYYDPAHRGFGPLRVINDDIVAPGKGFGMHPHDNMEIITWVLSGTLEHKDSMGNGGIIRPNEAQHMSAGTGILHSEFNPSKTDPVHLLQIWIMPDTRHVTPRYAQKNFAPGLRHNAFQLIASSTGRDGSIPIYQDADMWVGDFNGPGRFTAKGTNRKIWVQVARGEITLGALTLKAGDGVAIEGEATLNIHQAKNAQIIVFDMDR